MNLDMTSEIDKLKHFHVKNKHIGNCPDCVFNKYLCYGLLCNIVVLKVVKDEEMRNNK